MVGCCIWAVGYSPREGSGLHPEISVSRRSWRQCYSPREGSGLHHFDRQVSSGSDLRYSPREGSGLHPLDKKGTDSKSGLLQSPRGERIASMKMVHLMRHVRVTVPERGADCIYFASVLVEDTELQSPRGERIASAKRHNPDATDLCNPLGFLIL